MTTTTDKVAVVGLGYVGLPLAVASGGKIDTIGFDINEKRVASIQRSVDPTREMINAELKAAPSFTCTTKPEKLREAQVIIIAVTTPIDTAHQPDFGPMASASRVVGRNMRKGVTVVYESTVYPGATE
jgi:UDP-N-acetyl-D-galactosamine dehydrogenase